jgi:hypothetical protein
MVGVAGSCVGDGLGVCVGGNVAVIMTSGVGVGVSGTVTSALQEAVLITSMVKNMKNANV